MKRLFSMVLVIVTLSMIFTCCTAYAENFSVRNGISFGMNKKEVIALEKQNGFEKYEDVDEDDRVLYSGYEVLKLSVSSIGGINVGLLGHITYCFDESGELDNLLYEFGMILGDAHDESYNSIRNSLLSKYGDPIVENERTYVFTTPIIDRFNNVHRRYGGQIYHNSQWLYKYDDCCVIIDLIEFSRSRGASNNPDIMVEYKRISHEEVNDFFEQVKQQQQENEQERNRDF